MPKAIHRIRRGSPVALEKTETNEITRQNKPAAINISGLKLIRYE